MSPQTNGKPCLEHDEVQNHLSCLTFSHSGSSCGRYKSRGKAENPFSPEKLFFRFAESVLKPRNTARILGGQNTKKKNVLSFFRKNHPAKNIKARNIFSFWCYRVKRGGGGAISLPYFVLKIGSNLVQ